MHVCENRKTSLVKTILRSSWSVFATFVPVNAVFIKNHGYLRSVQCFDVVLPFLQTETMLEKAAFDVIRQASEENVIYPEEIILKYMLQNPSVQVL